MTRPLWLLTIVFFAGCTRATAPNAACEWHPEPAAPLDLSKSSHLPHLSDDALTAEDRAIRHADFFYARRAPAHQYIQARSECMGKLFNAIAKNHSVAFLQVREGLWRRRTAVDFAVILSFALLFSLAASLGARQISRRYPLEDGWVGPLTIAVFASIVVASAGSAGGRAMAFLLEGLRVGNSHLSYRADRIPWIHHRVSLFTGGLIIFWLTAGYHYRGAQVRVLER